MCLLVTTLKSYKINLKLNTIVFSFIFTQMNKAGLVSIGMPTYNRASTIRRAVDSLLNQTYKNIELIISDDGSTDETQKICEAYAAKDSRIKYIRHPQNTGHVNNFVFVLREAKGDYFMWAADDDRWGGEFIEKLVDTLNKNLSHNLAMSSYQRVYTDGEIYDNVVFSGTADLTDMSHYDLYKKMVRREPVHHCDYGLWRRDFLNKVFSRPKPEGIHWDRIFMSEVALSTRIATIPDILFFKDQNRIALKKRYKNQALGQSYFAPLSYSRYFSKLLTRPITSSVIPLSRKLALPFLWLDGLWFERKKIFWDFVRAARQFGG